MNENESRRLGELIKEKLSLEIQRRDDHNVKMIRAITSYVLACEQFYEAYPKAIGAIYKENPDLLGKSKVHGELARFSWHEKIVTLTENINKQLGELNQSAWLKIHALLIPAWFEFIYEFYDSRVYKESLAKIRAGIISSSEFWTPRLDFLETATASDGTKWMDVWCHISRKKREELFIVTLKDWDRKQGARGIALLVTGRIVGRGPDQMEKVLNGTAENFQGWLPDNINILENGRVATKDIIRALVVFAHRAGIPKNEIFQGVAHEIERLEDDANLRSEHEAALQREHTFTKPLWDGLVKKIPVVKKRQKKK